jgi:hypothetical protein
MGLVADLNQENKQNKSTTGCRTHEKKRPGDRGRFLFLFSRCKCDALISDCLGRPRYVNIIDDGPSLDSKTC